MNVLTNILNNLKGDKVVWLLVSLLGLFSLFAVYSSIGSMAYSQRSGNTEYYLIQQMVFLLIGGFLLYRCYKLNYIYYSKLAPILLAITIPLLAYTIGFGNEINDARRWLTVPWLDLSFQTSDFAKLALIIYVARSIAKKQDVIKDWRSSFLPIIIPIVLVCGLIAPADLSTAALLFVTCLLMMIIGRVSLKYIALLIGLGIVAFLIIYTLGTIWPDFVRIETWNNRITDFLQNSDGGWQIQQSKIAIAKGGIFGEGMGHSTQRNNLPYPYADFIYAIICEEYGVVGGIGIIIIYLTILFRCITLVTRCPMTFGSILAMGLSLNIVIQAFANIAVSVHLVPVTGLTLPMISMGGTSLIFTCISFGIILSVSRYVEEYYRKKLALNRVKDESRH